MYSTFVQADGSRIEIDVDDFEIADPWDSTVFVMMPLDGRSPDALRRRELHVAHRGNYDLIISDLGAEIYHRLSAQGGEFLIATPRGRGAGVALWRGSHHEVAVPVPNNNGARDPATALRPLMGLDFSDSVDGLQITPQPSMNATISVLDSHSYVTDVGEIGVRSPTEALGNVPGWSGARVPQGEVWRIDEAEDPDDPGEFLLFASKSAIMTITPVGPSTRRGRGPVGGRGRSSLTPALEFSRRVRRLSLSR